MRAVVVLSLFIAAIYASSYSSNPETHFEQFVTKFGKSYSSTEFQIKFKIFHANLEKIDNMNKLEGRDIYGITKFSDISPQEFRKIYLTAKPNDPHKLAAHYAPQKYTGPLPNSFDWTTKGAVTPIKNQEQCGSCWAFSTVETIESAWFLSGKSLPVLSPQQIVDCDVNNGDMGCEGGDTTTAYQYVMTAGGLDSEASYPYTGEDDSCAFKKADIQASISNWTYVTTNKNETEMQVALFTQGPLSICVDATTWQFYVGGIVTTLCGDSLDHCVQITGFETLTDDFGYQVPVWMVRNSWGADWGENGFIWVERGKDLCGVADEVTLPIV